MANDQFAGLKDPVPSRTMPGYLDFCENLNPYYREHTYPASNPLFLRERIAEAYGIVHGPQDGVGPRSMLLTNGAVDALNLALAGLSRPGQKAALLSPSFVAFGHFAEVHRLQQLVVPLAGPNFDEVPLDLLRETQPDFTILSNPNNPTGTVLSLRDIEQLCAITPGLVIVDEAYVEFSGRDSAISLLDKIANLLVLRTFSKAFALPHARCGLILSSPSIIEAVKCVQVPFSVSHFAFAEVETRLDDLPNLRTSWQRLADDRKQMATDLASLNLPGRILPSAGNFITIQSAVAEAMHAHLLSDWIQTLNPRVYPGFLRISLGERSQNEIVVNSLRKFRA